jgi:hypothetical protein
MTTEIQSNNNNNNVEIVNMEQQLSVEQNEIAAVQKTIASEFKKLTQLVNKTKASSVASPKQAIKKNNKTERRPRMSRAQIEAIARKFLGGKLIRDVAYLGSLQLLGGVVYQNVDINTFEKEIRALFAAEINDGAAKSVKFDDVFNMFFMSSLDGYNKFDAVLAFRTKSGSVDMELRAALKKWCEDSEMIETKFGDTVKLASMSNYRRKRGVVVSRVAKSEPAVAAGAADVSNGDDSESLGVLNVGEEFNANAAEEIYKSLEEEVSGLQKSADSIPSSPLNVAQEILNDNNEEDDDFSDPYSRSQPVEDDTLDNE